MSEENVEAAESAERAQKQLSATWQGAKDQLVMALLPAVEALTKASRSSRRGSRTTPPC